MKIEISSAELKETNNLIEFRDKMTRLVNATQNDSQTMVEFRCGELRVAVSVYHVQRDSAKTKTQARLLDFECDLILALNKIARDQIKKINDNLPFNVSE